MDALFMLNCVLRLVVLFLASSALAQSQCNAYFAVVFEDPAKTIHHGLSADEQRWFAKIQKKYPGVCYVEPPHSFYQIPPGGGPPVLDGDLVFPNVAPEIAPILFYVTASSRTYQGTRTVTNTTRTTAPVSGTATDSNGEVYHVSGTADITTTTQQEIPYAVDYEDLNLLVQQKQWSGAWKTLDGFERRTLCPALYGICVGNRHPYQKLLEQAIKWVASKQPQLPIDFQPEEPVH